jgi:hypothetical protein
MTKKPPPNDMICTTAIWSHELRSDFTPISQIPIQSHPIILSKALKTDETQSQKLRQTDKIALSGTKWPLIQWGRGQTHDVQRVSDTPLLCRRFRHDRPAGGYRPRLRTRGGFGQHAQGLCEGLGPLCPLVPDDRCRAPAPLARDDRALPCRSGQRLR